MKAAFASLFLLILLPWLAGCGSATGETAVGIDLTKVKNVWVERRLADNNGVRDRFVRALQQRGLQAEAGPLTMMPETGVDAVLVYEDRWDWNFGAYMMDLRVELRNPRTQALMATSFVQRAPFVGGSADDMVVRAVTELFRERAKRLR